MRPRQWVKNAFVFAPLFFTPAAVSVQSVILVALIFISFCLVASGVYCLNDLRDREADREHPAKRKRPLPSGRVSPVSAVILCVILLACGFGLAVAVVPRAAMFILVYVVLNLAYSFGLKHVSIIDVLVIAIGFVLRIFAGAEAIGVAPTAWIQICAGLLALFIALAKRRDDLAKDLDTNHRPSLRGYTKQFLDVCVVVTLAALLVSYLIFTLDDHAMQRLGSDKLYLTAPFVVAGIFRYLQLAVVYERTGSPTDLLFRDYFLLGIVVSWVVTFAYMIYV